MEQYLPVCSAVHVRADGVGDEAARARALLPRRVEPPPAFRPGAPRPFTPDPARCTPSPSGLPPPNAGHQGEWPRGRNFRAALRSPACPTRRRAILEPILEHLGRLRPAWCACPDRVCTFGHPARGALVQDRVCARFVPPPARLSRPLPPSGACACARAYLHMCDCARLLARAGREHRALSAVEPHARSLSPMISPSTLTVVLSRSFFSPVGGWPPGRP